MQFDQVVRQRHSVRSYRDEQPSEKDIAAIVHAADLAPSAGGLKSRTVFLVRSLFLRKQLAIAAHGQEFVAQAPVVLIFCADHERISEYGQRGIDLYCIQDTSAAIQNALLKATDLGLGSCWVSAFDEEQVSQLCRIPQHLRPIALVTIGYEK